MTAGGVMVEGVMINGVPQERFFIAARKALGWSQRDLATKAGVSVSTIADFERGKRKLIRSNFSAICRALGSVGIQFAVTDDEIVGVAWPNDPEAM